VGAVCRGRTIRTLPVNSLWIETGNLSKRAENLFQGSGIGG
jgi:hypothetical protein